MGYLRSKVAITRRTLRDYGADGAPIFFLRNNGNFHKPPLPGSCMPAHNVFGCPHRKPNRRRVANVEKAKSLNLSLGLLRARFAKFVSARKNDVLVSRSRLSGHTSGRSTPLSDHARQFQDASTFDAASTYRYNLSHDALQMQLRLVLLCVTIVSYGTQAILAETARARMEGAIRRLARWRAAGWKNLPLSGSPRS